MYDIEISNQQECLEIDAEFFAEVARRTLSAEGVPAAEISIAVVDNDEIWSLNRRFLNHDYPTDVLSFALDDDTPSHVAPGDQDEAGPGDRPSPVSGEVVLSAEMALQTALEYHWNPRDELALYLVHGLLHLCGYDDHTEQERQVMRTREVEILRHWNLSPHYAASDVAALEAGGIAPKDSTGADS
jgi:probable rRNA maturation factor